MKKLCPVCRKFYKPGPFVGHMKKHVRRGEAVKREVVRPETGNVTRYQWSRSAEYRKA